MVVPKKYMFRMTLTALFLLQVLGLLACSQTNPGATVSTLSAAHQTTPPWPHELSDLEPDPAVVFGRLPNGFRYVLMHNTEPQHRVYMHLNIQAGSLFETEEQRGLAHYLEHMLFNGSTHFEPGELVKYFQSIGMRFGADANAHTGFDETVYDIRLPDGSRDSIEQGLLVMGDYAEGALLLESEVERERGVILAEKQTRDSASYRTFKKAMAFEFPDALVSKRLPIGTDEALRAADRKELKDFYDTWYRPERMVLVMVGEFEIDVAESLIKERFTSLIYLSRIRYSEITADGDPERWQETLAEIEQTLRQALVHGFTQGELDRVKKDYLADLKKAARTASTRESRRLSRTIIRSLNSNQVFLSPAQEQELFSPFIETLDLPTVERAFRNIWRPDHRLVMVTGNAQLANGDKDVLTAFQTSTAQRVAPPRPAEAVAFPYLPEPDHIGRITDRRTIEDLGLTQGEFDNGVRLNVKRTDFKANEVRITVSFGSGKSSEWTDRPGLAKFSEQVVNESGLGRLTAEELARATAGTNTAVVFRVKGDSFLFEGKSVPDEVPLLFQLLNAHFLDPAFRDDAFQLVKQRFRQEYAELSRSVDGGMELSGTRFLAGGDSRFGFPNLSEIDAIRLEDIERWILAALQNGPLEVSVVGDVTEEIVIQSAAQYLGSLPRRMATDTVRTDLPSFPKSQSRELTVQTKIPKSLVVVAYPTADIWDIRRTRRLSVLAGVFSERLREEIREKLGAAYSPRAYNAPSRAYDGYGVLKVVIPTDPGRVTEVIGEVKRIAALLAREGVTDDELRRVVDPMVAGINDMRRDNRYWLNTVLTGATRYPQQLDWSRSIEKDYATISTEEVSDIAKKYLENSTAATVVIRPGATMGS
ncbi:hypothetical protein D3OALGB2SA_2733 [Olavius algarvensis associated proteobacterium Delta 3]|nr:hypothetical protein D3OALGB2SA_2733 [Olavius algarvensis associated proteobacterium Delta 3]